MKSARSKERHYTKSHIHDEIEEELNNTQRRVYTSLKADGFVGGNGHIACSLIRLFTFPLLPPNDPV